MKRIVSIQDISCVGKCSLTVALPIISAMGVETGIIPTAVLSTHTMFENYTFHDLTDELPLISDVWKKENIDFDAIYTGYIGSLKQIELIGNIFDEFNKKDNIILVDPVLGDNGSLYKGFDQKFVDEMAKLCKKADVILPNMTEATSMLHMEYPGDDYDEAYVKEILRKLTGLGAKKAVITGVSFDDKLIGFMGYDSETDTYMSYFNERVPALFHGTGDIFASVTIGALMNGFTLEESLKVAVDYTFECIKQTMANKEHRNYGVDFESAIPYLIKRIGK